MTVFRVSSHRITGSGPTLETSDLDECLATFRKLVLAGYPNVVARVFRAEDETDVRDALAERDAA